MNTVTAPPDGKSVDDWITEMQAFTAYELEQVVRSFHGRDTSQLSDSDLHKGLAALRLHRRTTAGPPKVKGSNTKVTIESLL